jgi:glycosyltransferase involved in cell wall biosynthesis
MKYNITFYCPDRHIQYDGGRVPDQKGVGGGVTVRIRMAHSLAESGHTVTMICNCLQEELDRNVLYVPLGSRKDIETDILIVTTSGDGLNLLPFLDLTVKARLRILLSHGVDQPRGSQQIEFDRFYAISNFIKTVMHDDWQVPLDRIFVSYHGVSRDYFQHNQLNTTVEKRNPFRLAYLGHPQKGRQAAIGILKYLRKKDSRYHLRLFGDERLWGEKPRMVWGVRGIKNFGLINQKKLARELLNCSYGIFLQTRREPFGLTIIEAMTAGCIPIASPTGAFPEIVQNGKNGFLIEEEPNDPVTWSRVADLICELQADPARLENLRRNAQNWPLDWQEVVKTWEQHWDMLLGNADLETFKTKQACRECQSSLIQFTDGLHCFSCGAFFKDLEGVSQG